MCNFFVFVFCCTSGGIFFFSQVDSRSTARIPIVIFKDGVSGLECDISVMNPLAVRNTRLLKVLNKRLRKVVVCCAYVLPHALGWGVGVGGGGYTLRWFDIDIPLTCCKLSV